MYENYKLRSRGYTHYATIVVKDAAALLAYDSHPAHEAFCQTYLFPILDIDSDDLIVVDYYSEQKVKKTWWHKISPLVHAFLVGVVAYGAYRHRHCIGLN